LDGALCGLTILELYESGLALTTQGYVFDPLVNGVHQWVTVPTCTGATGIAADICDLADGKLHDKQQNDSGQFILNVNNRAFLYTPCSPFPGGGSTGGCFPGPGAFPASEPATLALFAIALLLLGWPHTSRALVMVARRRPLRR
jgi:hypothetical protein